MSLVIADSVKPSANGTHHHPADDRPITLEVRNLSAGYGDTVTLSDVSFAIRRGERIGLLGPNGAGKSTLFKAIMGIVPPISGDILIHQQPVSQATTRVAYVPQFEEIDWKFPVTVYDVVMMGRTRHIGWLRWSRKGDVHDRMVWDALARVQMTPFANHQISELSGGQKRRVFIARALAQEANILLLDEPFAGVDANAQNIIFNVLEALCNDGVTILLATHDLGMAATHFDKLILLNKTMLAFGRPADVFKPDILAQTFGGQMAIWKADPADSTSTMIVADHCCP
ncbi:MAG: metal ABC transporter ATP-binding protein [Anaerolineae bacterium]|nr:metal ABC transporter ATP-binding protein [Anaerolineae bacterium]